MTPLQTLENRASEMCAGLSELGGLEDFTDETRAELAALRRERQDNESKRNALRTAGDGPTPPVETRNDGVGHEGPLQRGDMGAMVDGVIEKRSSCDGANEEMRQHCGLAPGQVPCQWRRHVGPLGRRCSGKRSSPTGRHKCRRQLFRELPC